MSHFNARTRRAVCLAVVLLLSASVIAGAEDDELVLPPPAKGKIDFVRDIQPIFAKSCYSCHGAEKQKAGLRLDRKADAFEGGDSGPAFEPGNSEESLLIELAAGLDPEAIMPRKEEQLSADQIGLLRAWIDQGAPWPDSADVQAAVERPGSDHWAFQPINRPQPPAVENESWVRNPIDRFVLAKLESLGTRPSPEADRTTLIRRLSLDLLGLPPTPEEVDAFVGDSSPEAYDRLVNRLLASPHFGERWGRHWLDLARYADSDGYEKDLPRPYAWRWRDWVIDAINRDLPFDRFTIDQLAGDLLPDATLDQKIATGLHRNTLTNREGGVDPEEFRVKAVKDRVFTTGTIWLGLTVQCGECHSHKFDPFTQREYYGLVAFFNSTEELDLPAPLSEEAARYRIAKEKFDEEHAKLEAAVAELEWELPDRLREWETGLAIATEGPSQAIAPPNEIALILAVADEQRTPEQKASLSEYYRTVDPEMVKLKQAVEQHAKQAPKPPDTKVPVFAERPTPRVTHVNLRGDFRRPGPEVQPQTLAVLHPLRPRGEQPDRLDLARWLVDPANPLTPRVVANRIWQQLFGRGIVETPWDFGTQGAKPSHPKLLDWLATEYLRQGWSRKAMIRLIVQSATYRQRSWARRDLSEQDPKNDLLARQNRFRMDAEIIRDLYLSAGGLLYPKVGGPSVRPPLPAEVAALGYAGSVKWQESEAPDSYRRGMYIFFQRSVPYPMLSTFDAPESTVSCTRRDRSNTPLQALTLLNDPVFVECARALATRAVRGEADDVEARIRHGFRLCLAREPQPSELVRLRQLYDELLELYRADPEMAAQMAGGQKPEGLGLEEAAAWVALARTLLNLDELVTRE